jgi:hypothetical protein
VSPTPLRGSLERHRPSCGRSVVTGRLSAELRYYRPRTVETCQMWMRMSVTGVGLAVGLAGVRGA